MTPVPASLSVDLEFFSHLPAYRGADGTMDREAVGRAGVEYLLEAFDAADATGTFFAVSDVAGDHTNLLEAVVDAGHELASHTYSHRHLTEISQAERREEVATSREMLADATGAQIDGFRAPSFDFGDDLFDLLDETGYAYDSSVVPCRAIPGWYGGEFATRHPSLATAVDPTAPDGLMEVPVGVFPGIRLPLTGTWLRFFGVRYTLRGMSMLASRGIAPVLYVHPWELVDLPAVDGVPRRVYWRTGSYMRRAVDRILGTDFEFVTVRDLADDARAAGTDAPGTGASTHRSTEDSDRG